ncbi:MAG: bifunctional histidinol-phosphatase/imidazoleglycerol-phosphate dehydratase HisB [Bacteroidales bacterium]|nr:bifunctional histidinol-phosphatase/imidazoleglycerol-phosphate dehydratase HisB [Bacteroidales bacterium]
MKRVLFIDRDGTLIKEPPVTYQVDRIDQLEFLPAVLRNLYFICKNLDFELVMVTNQDGLGTPVYPQENFDAVQGKMLQILESEGVHFDAIFIDKTFEADNAPTRKPRTGMLTSYIDNPDYDLANSYVIGDRLSDVQLAQNLGAKAILLDENMSMEAPADCTHLASWDAIADFLFAGGRKARVHRVSKETDVLVEIDLNGSGKTHIDTGLKFFDHMLDQIGRHSLSNLTIITKGDLQVDEHHTIEDTAIALGEAILQAIGNKRGIDRYGYCLPMDDSLCSLALDFGGRPWLVWEVNFKREYVGDMPTEMFLHFFKSLSDAARMNLNIKAEGDNEHHKAEAVFKAFALAMKMAVRRDIYRYELPSTKGLL